MAASTSRGVTIQMVKTGATPTAITVTAVSTASPAVVTATNTLGPGDLIYFPPASTGFPEIDGKRFVVSAATATEITLEGSSTVGTTGAFAAGADTPKAYAKADMVTLCWSSLAFNPETTETIAVGTFCDPSAQIASSVTGAGTLDFGGYVDIAAADYKALVEAVDKKGAHEFVITLPSNGHIVFNGELASLNVDVPLEGAITYSGQITLMTKPVHQFA